MITRWTTRWRAFRRWWSRPEWAVRWLGLPCSPVDRNQEGLILIQIDGLSRAELEHAISHGRMPFLQSLIDRQRYRLHSFYSGMPSSTPAVQGELFYGVKTAVPAFGYIEHESNRPVVMFSPDAAAQVQARISEGKLGLLEGGSSYCNIYDGGASESHFCAASIGWAQILQAVHPSKLAFVTTWYGASLMRAAGLVFLELGLGGVDFLRRAITGRELLRELVMIASRVVVAIGLRELSIISASMDAARGLPTIHLNLLGFDEHAHRRGPSSNFARCTLKGIDRSIRRLASAARLSGRRDYDVWVYSDHGQESTTPYDELAGRNIEQACQLAVASTVEVQAKPTNDSAPRPSTRAQWLSAAQWVTRFFGESASNSDHPPPSVQVADCGPIGLLYCQPPLTNAQRLRVANELVTGHDVPMVCVRQTRSGILAVTKRGEFELPRQAREVFGPDHPFVDDVAQDLAQLCHHDDAGEMVLSGWCRESKPISFAGQWGAHAGPGPNETHGFALLPCDAVIKPSQAYLRPSDLRRAALAHRSGSRADRGNHPAVPPRQSPRSFRLMTYNVHACRGMDGQLSPKRIARVIAQANVDVVALQELDVGRIRSGAVDQAHEIAGRLQMDHHFHAAWTVEEEQYGDAILSRLPMRCIQAGKLPSSKQGREPRGAIWVEIQGQGLPPVQVINTHLCLYPGGRKAQSRALRQHWVRSAKRRGPTVLCGDFNAMPNSPAYRMLSTELCDAHVDAPGATMATWFSHRPLTRIDHVFSSPDLSSVAAEVINSDLAKVASDHLPLVIEFQHPAKR